MEETERTVDSILNGLERHVRERVPLDPQVWMEGALDLTVLMGNEHAKLYELQSGVAKLKLSYVHDGKSVSHAKAEVEATDAYREMLLQKAKIDRIIEMIRCAKLQARLAETEMRNG